MKRFLKKRPVKAAVGALLVLAVIIAACNAAFAAVALKEQKGTAVCDKWSAEDTYTPGRAHNMEAGAEDFKILCLTDIHIRNHDTFAAALGVNFILDGMSEIQLTRLIKHTAPDLIIVGGDTVLTAWNDICTQQFADFMDKFEIPWAPIFGNHDYEGRADKAKLAEIYEGARNCLFQSGPEGMNGMGNYIVNITREGTPVYSLFLLDDGQFRVDGGKISDGGVGSRLIEWYQWAVDGIARSNGGQKVPNMAFMHVPVPEYKNITDGYSSGQRGEDTCTAEVNDGFFEIFKQNGGTHMFAGHDHNNNFIATYEGVTLGYMTKSSYNCYFDFNALGGTLLTMNQSNRFETEIISFSDSREDK